MFDAFEVICAFPLSHDTISLSHDTISLSHDTISLSHDTISLSHDTISLSHDTISFPVSRNRGSIGPKQRWEPFIHIRVPLCYTSIIKYLFMSWLGVAHMGVDNISQSKQPYTPNFSCHRHVITLHRVTKMKYEALKTRFVSPTQLLRVTLVGVTRC